eukprot:Trichotokara_eunicae@DN4456_c0_g1_i1.p1
MPKMETVRCSFSWNTNDVHLIEKRLKHLRQSFDAGSSVVGFEDVIFRHRKNLNTTSVHNIPKARFMEFKEFVKSTILEIKDIELSIQGHLSMPPEKSGGGGMVLEL